MSHIHIVGGPHDGEVMSFDLGDDEDYYPELLVIPTSEEEGELYELAEEDYPCGYPKYLYAGYDWESIDDLEYWDELGEEE